MPSHARAAAVFALLVSLSLAACASPGTTGAPEGTSSGTTSGSAGASLTTAPSSPATDGLTPFGTLADGSRIVLLAWNDLGMHCYNADFSKLAILPPYNNLHAQVIRVGGEPRPVTSGVTVEYRFPGNTYSAGVAGKPDKTDFWKYAKALFGVALKPNVGLTGRGLTGSFDASGTQYLAIGIPLTDIRDPEAASGTRYPFQLARVTVRDDSTGKLVAGLDVVAPVSTEMRCDRCHGDTGIATKMGGVKGTGDYYTNILALHDALNPNASRTPLAKSAPVLCASCHSDNALGAPGKPGVKSMSNAMHGIHAAKANIPDSTDGCYSCHPGPQTRCLRDVHAQTLGFQCPTCHGSLAKVATNPSPWLNEPRCDSSGCHKNTPPALLSQTQALYRNSTGHHGGVIMCAACHDSTHALARSREANDNLKFLELQRDASYLRTCRTCHGVDSPDGQTKAHAAED